MKRFYKLVSVHREPNGWAIHLDGRPVRTPMRKTLLAPSESLAQEIVKEWSDQEEEIVPNSMPITQILSTQVDRVSEQREDMSQILFKYLDTDLLCYRADPEPPSVAPKQEETWDPWLKWFQGFYAVALKTTTDLAALSQPGRAHDIVQDKIKAMDDARFNVLQLVVSASGSLVLGLAFVEGQASPEQVLQAARVEENSKDEIYNARKYGRDPMLEAKDSELLKDLNAAHMILSHL